MVTREDVVLEVKRFLEREPTLDAQVIFFLVTHREMQVLLYSPVIEGLGVGGCKLVLWGVTHFHGYLLGRTVGTASLSTLDDGSYQLEVKAEQGGDAKSFRIVATHIFLSDFDPSEPMAAGTWTEQMEAYCLRLRS